MEKMKVFTILGTRPEIIRLSAIIRKMELYFDHYLVHTGQNYDYDLNGIFFDELNLKAPDFYLDCVGPTLGATIGSIIQKSYDLLSKERPDAVLILGDTNSALAAIAAKRLHIPVFHMEAGNRCWDWCVPEMTNRTIVDHISDINIAYTNNSKQFLVLEGIDPKFVFVSGTPMREVAYLYNDLIVKSQILEKFGIEEKQYILMSFHREENVEDKDHLFSIIKAVNDIAEKYQIPIIVNTHPRTQNALERSSVKFHDLIKLIKPVGYFDYVKLQKSAYVVISDSGSLSEEAAIFDFPGVMLRNSTERQEANDAGTIVIGGIMSKTVMQSIDIAVGMKNSGFKLPFEYQVENVSEIIVKLIQSYTPIINEKTWRKKQYV
ncbi:MAG: UDP-N-acetylglucosamine 2-epimerase (non-hydrolyzing) [Bacilli bacterium]|nr:UDP-N-acetylglucosamine 2-epimerase (non-hydrolyzing) [Bacilli bacterium]